MKKIFWEGVLAVALAWGLPWLFLGLAKVTATPGQTEPTAPAVTQPAMQTVPVLTDDGLVEMEMNEYLTGVLLGELPADFHMEAKKAQAVVARTYTLRTVTQKDKHRSSAICTYSGCCQGYTSPDDYIAAGGSGDAVTQAREAVAQTEGMVLTYGGALIDATYFSCSGGQTEDALAVWGADIPYLQSVESPGEELATHYTDTVRYHYTAIAQILELELSDDPRQWLGEVTYTQGGGVDTMVIGEETFSGTQLRARLELRSTAFTMTAVGESVIITTKGFGHRVGMSQYGAQAMAQSGSTFDTILAHYYRGTALTSE